MLVICMALCSNQRILSSTLDRMAGLGVLYARICIYIVNEISKVGIENVQCTLNTCRNIDFISCLLCIQFFFRHETAVLDETTQN